MEEPATHTRLAGDVLERRARDPARCDAGAHGVHDPLDLVAAQLALDGLGLRRGTDFR
jgi:hypothetical protein